MYAALIFTFFSINTSGSFPRLDKTPQTITDAALWNPRMIMWDGGMLANVGAHIRPFWALYGCCKTKSFSSENTNS